MTSRSRQDALAATLCALYALATSAWYVAWHRGFAERSADEGMFENLLWNATHGHGLRTAIENQVPHLAVHFSPVLYAIAPLYACFPSMHIVHFVTAALIAVAGAVFHRHVARTLEPGAAIPLMVVFLLCPTIVLQTFMEFHEQALAVLPLTVLLVAWSQERRAAALLGALALLSVREDNALLVLALGMLSLTAPRRRRTGFALVTLGVVWLALWRVVGIRLLGGEQLPSVFGETYAQWGRTPSEIVRAVLTHPLDVARHLLARVPLQYLALLLVPALGLLPFGSALVLVMLPQLAMILLAGHDSRMFQIRMHYSIAPAIVVLFAAVDTLSRLPATAGGGATRVRRWAPIAMMAIALLLVPGWALRARARLNPYTREIRAALAAVPDTASVSAPGYLINHLAARHTIGLMWSETLPATSMVVLEDSSRFFLNTTTVDAFFTPRFDSLLRNGGFVKTYARDGWHVYQRSAPAR